MKKNSSTNIKEHDDVDDHDDHHPHYLTASRLGMLRSFPFLLQLISS